MLFKHVRRTCFIVTRCLVQHEIHLRIELHFLFALRNERTRVTCNLMKREAFPNANKRVLQSLY